MRLGQRKRSLPTSQNLNLLLTYERAKTEEAVIQAEYENFASLIGVIVAVVGFVITGAFSALDKLTWGLSQISGWDALQFCTVNYISLFAGILCGVFGLKCVRDGYRDLHLVLPWKNETSDPDLVVNTLPDEVLATLIFELAGHNTKNKEILGSRKTRLFQAAEYLLWATLFLLFIGGYNAMNMAARQDVASQKEDKLCVKVQSQAKVEIGKSPQPKPSTPIAVNIDKPKKLTSPAPQSSLGGINKGQPKK